MAEPKDWKSKYFDSLQQLEDVQSTWDALEKLLRKTISRLAISAKGFHAPLDQQLLKIQQHSKEKDNKALEADLHDLSTLLSKMDIPSPEPVKVNEKKGNDDFHVFLLQLIDQLQLDTDPQLRLNDFKASIAELDIDHTLNGLAELLNELLQHEPNNSVAIQNVLITLIEKISFTHGGSENLNTLKETLDFNFEIEQWSDYLDDIISEVHTIIQSMNHEKNEMEDLIIDVTHQLNEISSVLTDNQSDTETGRKDAQQLQSQMDDSLASIQTQVNQENDIGKLKDGIKNQLSAIKLDVASFISRDNDRHQISEQRNQKLQQRIIRMELESDTLQQKLSENRQKLMFDTLTGVRSRLSFDEILDLEIQRWERYQDDFSFAILDIDHFKRINDQYGHNAGDKALQIIAKMMTKHIRQTDFLFRIGGEEFVLLLPKTNLQNAQPVVEKIRASVGDSSFHFKQAKVDISLSAGLTSFQSEDNRESVYERADKALYEAKNTGRDRLVVKSA